MFFVKMKTVFNCKIINKKICLHNQNMRTEQVKKENF